MTALQKLSLEDAGLKYIESSLDNGGKGLCLKLLGLPLAQGSTYTIVPEDIDIDRAYQFETGGHFNIDIKSWLAEHVIKLSSANAMGTLIFQDVWGAKPEDSGFKKIRRSKMFFNQTDVYHFVEANNITKHYIVRAMEEIASYLLIGMFVNVPVTAAKLSADRFVDDKFIENLARHTQEIYVSAYDQESIVVWQRKALPTKSA